MDKTVAGFSYPPKAGDEIVWHAFGTSHRAIVLEFLPAGSPSATCDVIRLFAYLKDGGTQETYAQHLDCAYMYGQHLDCAYMYGRGKINGYWSYRSEAEHRAAMEMEKS